MRYHTAVRIGHGHDLHRLQEGGKLFLAGVVVSESISAVAHSDGDVVIHALVDALLGAMGWGDIGERFPNSDPRWQGAESRIFLQQICSEVNARGYRLVNADVTVLVERPKIAPFKHMMKETLAGLMNVSSELMNIKAGTNEGCDAIGRGEAIAAHVVVLLEPTH